jgi:hypothetical protein
VSLCGCCSENGKSISKATNLYVPWQDLYASILCNIDIMRPGSLVKWNKIGNGKGNIQVQETIGNVSMQLTCWFSSNGMKCIKCQMYTLNKHSLCQIFLFIISVLKIFEICRVFPAFINECICFFLSCSFGKSSSVPSALASCLCWKKEQYS